MTPRRLGEEVAEGAEARSAGAGPGLGEILRSGLVALCRQAEGDAAGLAIDGEDGDFHRLPDLEELTWVAHLAAAAGGELGDVKQPVDSGGELDEGAEEFDPCHPSLAPASGHEAGGLLLQGILHQRARAEIVDLRSCASSSATRPCPSSETCSRPSMPPRSTKAP